MLQVYIRNVSYALEVCFNCFHTDMVKVDRNVTHIAMVMYMYIASVYSQCFIYFFFIRILQVCLSGYCICFAHMLQVFYLDISGESRLEDHRGLL
jgi:hypothetical protein